MGKKLTVVSQPESSLKMAVRETYILVHDYFSLYLSDYQEFSYKGILSVNQIHESPLLK